MHSQLALPGPHSITGMRRKLPPVKEVWSVICLICQWGELLRRALALQTALRGLESSSAGRPKVGDAAIRQRLGLLVCSVSVLAASMEHLTNELD